MELGSTAEQQAALERAVAAVYADVRNADSLVLRREAHARYLLGGLRHLSAGHCGARAPAASHPSSRLTPAVQRWTPAGRGWSSGSRTAWRCSRFRCLPVRPQQQRPLPHA